MQPLISIIITILNGEKTIGQCLKSIYDQSYTNYEVVIIDGGSTDHTVALVDASPLKNKLLRIIPGIGLYAGLNAGSKLAQGKWFYFMGCDDQLYEPNTLQKVANVIASNENKAQVFVGNVACIKQENLLRASFGSPYWMKYHVHHQGMFYMRSLFDSASYNENMRIASDYEFNLKLALERIPHQPMNIIICNFGGDGISENQVRQGFREMQEVHKRLFNGVDRQWALFCYWLQQEIILLRKRLNLVNLKVRLKRLLGAETSVI